MTRRPPAPVRRHAAPPPPAVQAPAAHPPAPPRTPAARTPAARTPGAQTRRASGASPVRPGRTTPFLPRRPTRRARLALALRRRAPSRRAVVLALLAAALVAAATWVLLASPVTAVREGEVSVTGTSRTDPAAVRAAAAGQVGRPLLRVDEDAVRAGVADLPYVRSLAVERSWPHGLVLAVTEEVPVAAVPGPAGVDLLDAEGAVITTLPEAPPDVPVVSVDVAAAGPGAVRAAGEVAASLPARLRADVAEVSAASPDDVRLRLREGQEVRWGGAGSSDLKARVLQVLRQRPASGYDVSAPSAPATW